MALFELAAQLFAVDHQPKGVAHATAFQAWAAYQLGRLDEAAALAGEALALHRDAEDWPPPITALVTLGAATGGTAPERAIAHLTEALRLAREDDHLQNQAWCLNYLAVALRQAGRYDEALADHRRALQLVEDSTERQWAVNFLNSYAETCLAAGRIDEAREIYQQALDLAESTGYAHEAAVARQGLTTVSE